MGLRGGSERGAINGEIGKPSTGCRCFCWNWSCHPFYWQPCECTLYQPVGVRGKPRACSVGRTERSRDELTWAVPGRVPVTLWAIGPDEEVLLAEGAGLETGGMSIDFIHRMPIERLDPLLEGTIFRIVQEAIANARRHSRSDRALVRLTQLEARTHVEVRDWGIGFHPAKVGRGRLGLAGIRERARLLNGWASIESSPGRGTRIRVELPAAGVSTRKALVHAKDRSAE